MDFGQILEKVNEDSPRKKEFVVPKGLPLEGGEYYAIEAYLDDLYSKGIEYEDFVAITTELLTSAREDATSNYDSAPTEINVLSRKPTQQEDREDPDDKEILNQAHGDTETAFWLLDHARDTLKVAGTDQTVLGELEAAIKATRAARKALGHLRGL